MTNDDEHVHVFRRTTRNHPTQTSEGKNWQGELVVLRWHVEEWVDKCDCGQVSATGSETVVE
jgi:hypothetical protein